MYIVLVKVTVISKFWQRVALALFAIQFILYRKLCSFNTNKHFTPSQYQCKFWVPKDIDCFD